MVTEAEKSHSLFWALDVQGQRKTDISAQADKMNPSSLHLFVLFWPPEDWVMPAHIGEGIFLTQATDSSVNVFQKHLHRHNQK